MTTPRITTGFAEVNGTRLYYEIAGEGHPLTLVHGGLVDRRLWDDQFDVFAQHYRVIRYDIRGFGDSDSVQSGLAPYSLEQDLYELLRFLGVEKTYLMGLSLGGAIATNFTLEHPEMVDALILVGSGLEGFEASEESKQKWAEFEEIFEKGDVEQIVELENRIWTDGPNRTPDQVNPTVRARVHEMNMHNFAIMNPEAPRPQELEPPAITRLSEIRVPTLIIVGDEDVRDILTIADILEKGIPGAKKVSIPNTAHHLNMEQPETFNRIVLEFLKSLE
jgi:pimeloyl-ACP methyl ester carboxylesterase